MGLVRLEKKTNGIWICELHRPDKLNALSAQLVRELTEVFKGAQAAAQSFECRAFLLKSSSPKAFCVGADLAERKAMNETQVVAALDGLRELMLSLEQIPCPTIAVLEGVALGGGLELALCCDVRVASESASMALTETRLAIIPGAGGTQRLTRLVGLSKAKEFIFTGKRIDAREALDCGILNAIATSPLEWAETFAAQVIEGGPVALLAAKEAIEKGWNVEIQEGLNIERAAYLKTLHTQDRLEGLQAFSEKRKPQYRGK
jgi:enoyl-CoA hydratase/carnithine racemase